MFASPQVDLDRNEILCDPEVANKMHLPQKQYHKLYKAVAPFCRRPNADADANGENAASAFPMAPPPDVNIDEHVVTVAEMSEEAVGSAISSIKAAFLRFFVSIMAKYQDVMIVPPSHIKLPAAIDFFDVRKWMLRFSGSCSDWLEMFTAGQSFTQWLEQRLAPRDSPLLEVVFFNENIDAKLMRSAKTKLFTKQSTPLLATGELPESGYNGLLVPAAVRTVYNASMIAARPVQSQQQVGLLVLLGSGMQEGEPEEVAQIEATLKREFARNLLWSRVDIGAALLVHICPWMSSGSAQLQPLAGVSIHITRNLFSHFAKHTFCPFCLSQKAELKTWQFAEQCWILHFMRTHNTSRSCTVMCTIACELWRRHAFVVRP